MRCLNRNTLEYQMLAEVSGISGFDLDSTIRFYLDKYNRYPELDEIPGANSQPNLLKVLEVKDTKGIKHLKVTNILEFTGATNIEEAVAIINNKYKDLETKLIQIDDEAIINIKKRPSEYGYIEKKVDVNASNVNSPAVIVGSLNKLRNLYGFNFIEINTDELNSDKWKGIIVDAKTTKAFVYNGDVYVNTDLAGIDSKVHELLHIFLGAMRYSDPELYFNIVSTAENMNNFEAIASVYQNRTHQDLLEEVFITEYAKYLTGQDSYINNLPINQLSKLDYTIRRTLDSVLMGNYSVKALDNIANSTLLELAQDVESEITNSVIPAFINASSLSRRVSNFKESLLKDNKLEENCE